MAARLIGAHMPTKGGLSNAIRRGTEIGCTAIQVFTSSPQQWKAKEVTSDAVRDFRDAVKENKIQRHALVSHDSYLINLAALDPELRAKSAAALAGELQRCHAYGIPYAVSHIGAHMGSGEDEGLKQAAGMLNQILSETEPDITILMETTAGQGTVLNSRFESLATLLDLCNGHKQLCVCLDTCHVFAAGYDIRTIEGYEETMSEFDRIVGLHRLKVIHANDSKKSLGSRVDRHEHIGQGEIGIEAFRCLVNDKRFAKTPIIVETPDAEENHERNVTLLRSLIRLK